MATYTVNDKTEDHIPDRLKVVDSVINLLKIERNYVAMEVLGSGTYGDVFKLFNPENQTSFAAKIVTHKMITEAESLLWPTLDHPNIVPLTEYVDLSIVKAVVYLMPMQETSLRAMMGEKEFRMNDDALEQVKKWLGQTLCGLEYLHNKDLVHLDIKEDNVLISHCSTAMLCDFTCLNKADKPIRSGKVGSPFMYKSPEAFYKGGTVEGKPCDLWAFGIMTVEILTDFFLSNNLPHIEHNWLMDVHPTLNEILQEQVFKKYFDVTFPKVEQNEDKVSRMALDFIHGFLKMDPTERATSITAKQHPFLIGGSDVVNVPDEFWNSELYMGASEFDDNSISCFDDDDEIGFSYEDVSNDGCDFLNVALKDFNTTEDEDIKTFGTQTLISRHPPVMTEMSPNSEFEKWYHSSSEILKDNYGTDNYSGVNNPQIMVDIISLSEPQVSKAAIYDQGNSTKKNSEVNVTDLIYGLEVSELDSKASPTTSKVLVCPEPNFAVESTNKFSTEYGVPLSEKIRNLRLRIKDLIENSGNIKGEKMLKAQPMADKVYFQREDVGLESRKTNKLHKSVKSNSKFTVEDCASGFKSTSLEATLEFLEAIKSLLKRHEDYKETNFSSIDVPSKECQEEILKKNSVGHNSAEENLPMDSASTTVLENRGRRQRFIGWLQSKCLSVLKFCCPCMTEQNSSKKA